MSSRQCKIKPMSTAILMPVIFAGLFILLAISTHVTFTTTGIIGLIVVLLAVWLFNWFVHWQEKQLPNVHSAVSDDIRELGQRWWLLFFTITSVTLVLIVMNPEAYVRLFLPYVTFCYIYLVVTAWRLSKGLALYWRLPLVIIFQLPTIIWFTSSAHSKIVKWASVVGFSLAIKVGWLTILILLLVFVSAPYYVSTTAFAPDLSARSIVMVNYVQPQPQTGDFVVYTITDRTQPLLGKVTAVNDFDYTVNTGNAEQTIATDKIIGTVAPVLP